jgi:hypothetical protein
MNKTKTNTLKILKKFSETLLIILIMLGTLAAFSFLLLPSLK